MDESRIDRSNVTRIFMGGLGTSVTVHDIERTFSPLGSVKEIEIIRTNGRNIAYMNFEPASEKALGKLFSTYNGCTWKGSKLRLEKAKEHYLLRLKQEWARDAELMNCSTAISSKETVPTNDPAHLEKEKIRLHIFFPRLKKVKVLPYSGSGKHRYSFPRVDAPPLPVHFCDCEEHSGQFPISAVKQLYPMNDATGGINAELSVRSSVMNKPFEKKKTKEAVMVSTVKETGSTNIDHEMSFSWDADQSTDDNLVTNILYNEAKKTLDLGVADGWDPTSDSKQCSHHKLKSSIKGTASKRKSQGTWNASDSRVNRRAQHHLSAEWHIKELSSSKLTESINLHVDDKKISMNAKVSDSRSQLSTNECGETLVQTSSQRETVGMRSKRDFSSSDICLRSGQCSEPQLASVESRSCGHQRTTQYIRGSCWMQKLSWNEMVGDASTFLFRL